MNSPGIYSNQMVNSRFHEKDALLQIKRWKAWRDDSTVREPATQLSLGSKAWISITPYFLFKCILLSYITVRLLPFLPLPLPVSALWPLISPRSNPSSFPQRACFPGTSAMHGTHYTNTRHIHNIQAGRGNPVAGKGSQRQSRVGDSPCSYYYESHTKTMQLHNHSTGASWSPPLPQDSLSST